MPRSISGPEAGHMSRFLAALRDAQGLTTDRATAFTRVLLVALAGFVAITVFFSGARLCVCVCVCVCVDESEPRLSATPVLWNLNLSD